VADKSENDDDRCAVAAIIWIGIPFITIHLATGLKSIPQELYEAAAQRMVPMVQKI
jgi:ABC-type sugar transport system permease subunit